MVGSGQFGMPCARTQRENFRISVSACWTSAAGQSPASRHCRNESALSAPPVLGSSCWQAARAARSWESLTPNVAASPLERFPLLSGSGKLGTPCARMQVEYASVEAAVDDPLDCALRDGDPLP